MESFDGDARREKDKTREVETAVVSRLVTVGSKKSGFNERKGPPTTTSHKTMTISLIESISPIRGRNAYVNIVLAYITPQLLYWGSCIPVFSLRMLIFDYLG